MAGLCEVCADSVTKSVSRSVCQPLIGNSRGMSQGLSPRRLSSSSFTHPAVVAITGQPLNSSTTVNTANGDGCTITTFLS